MPVENSLRSTRLNYRRRPRHHLARLAGGERFQPAAATSLTYWSKSEMLREYWDVVG